MNGTLAGDGYKLLCAVLNELKLRRILTVQNDVRCGRLEHVDVVAALFGVVQLLL